MKAEQMKLSKEERKIEEMIADLRPLAAEKKEKVLSIIREGKKNKSISFRISTYTLEQLKHKAKQEGIPYQTLIHSILHKYLTGQFYDKNEVLKITKIHENYHAKKSMQKS